MTLVGAAIFALVNLPIAPMCLVWAVYGAKGNLEAWSKCCEGHIPVILGSGFACSTLTLTLAFLIIGMMRLRDFFKRIADCFAYIRTLFEFHVFLK